MRHRNAWSDYHIWPKFLNSINHGRDIFRSRLAIIYEKFPPDVNGIFVVICMSIQGNRGLAQPSLQHK